MSPTTAVRLAVATVFCIVLAYFGSELFVTVGAPEIVIHQGAVDGKLDAWTQPGIHWQNFGRISTYKKSVQLWFSKKEAADEEGTIDESIKVRFNDGGHAQLSGSLRVTLPLDPQKLLKLHTAYGSQANVEHDLIKQVVTKAVYLTGSLMSSKESSNERRPDLIRYIEDQIANGVYRTTTRDTETLDLLTGQKKMVSIVEIVQDPKAPQGLARQERSPFSEFGLAVSNLTINAIDYDGDVEGQIKAQQKALMDVQTAQAEAKKAEQRALTVKSQGEALAAEAKWKQEALKAQAVTQAEQARDVAKLNLETEKLNKEALIAQGEGQAEKAKLIMNADGALEKKLATYENVMKAGFEMIGKQPLVPSVVIGQSGGATNSSNMLDMWQAKIARDLALDMGMQGK